ncbi:hypothetical protein [Paraburkholderia sp.]|uniref:hypothetical protein n=1 Tax=Paraburkholderia sp. TaxID=1926495 RepID=UPI003D7018FD
MVELNPDTPYLNIKRLVMQFEQFNCEIEESQDPAIRRMRANQALAFAMLVMCERITEAMRGTLEPLSDEELSHAKADGVSHAGGLRLVTS